MSKKPLKNRGTWYLAVVATMVLPMITACSGASGAAGTAGESYPSQPVTLVVPFSAGGSTDLGGRAVASVLQEDWGVSVSIENQTGGNTVPAVQSMMQAKPDGKRILLDNQPSSSMLEAAVPGLPFDVSDRTFIATAGATPMMFIVPANSPYKTLEEAVEGMKADPTGFTWTSLGGAGAQDLAFRKLFAEIGIDVDQTRSVAMPGGADAVTQTAGGHVDIGVGTWSATKPAYAGKLVRVLAIAGPERFKQLPNVPTTAEAGYPGVEALYWIGFSGPAGLDDGVVKAWNEALPSVLEDPELLKVWENLGIIPFYKSQDAMKEFVLKEEAEVGELFAK